MKIITPDLMLFLLLGTAIVAVMGWRLSRIFREQGVNWEGGPMRFIWGPARRITAADESRLYWAAVYIQAAMIALFAVAFAWMVTNGLVSK